MAPCKDCNDARKKKQRRSAVKKTIELRKTRSTAARMPLHRKGVADSEGARFCPVSQAPIELLHAGSIAPRFDVPGARARRALLSYAGESVLGAETPDRIAPSESATPCGGSGIWAAVLRVFLSSMVFLTALLRCFFFSAASLQVLQGGHSAPIISTET